MKKTGIVLASGAAAALPFVASAQDTSYITSFLGQIGDIVNTLPPIIIGIAVVVFLWGIVKFMTAGDDADKKAGAKSTMVWGLVAILVMVSLWGIIALLQGFFNIGGGATPDLNPLG